MKLILVWLFCVSIVSLVNAAGSEQLETCNDEKEFKNLLKTRPNVLVLFSRSDSEVKDLAKQLKEVNAEVKGTATVAYVNCEVNKKVCKKYKVNPQPYVLKHFNKGSFNKDYDRQIAKKSFLNFLKDPTGDMPWEEEESAKDVLFLRNENEMKKLFKLKPKTGILVMFYAPWCGACKKIKPDYNSAATKLKDQHVLAALNADAPENYNLRTTYNISGFPTMLFFKGGKMLFPYGGGFNENGLITWMNHPEAPSAPEEEKSWADEEDVHVTFLTTADFDSFLETHSSVLVMFYAPWCGHCKNIKPTMNNVAKKLKEENANGIIAFVDATKEAELGNRFKVKGYPTIKYFKDGKFAWDYSERDEAKILEFMRNPVEPAPKKPEPEWKDEPSSVIHAEDSNFASIVKTKKHALIFFYAPWCGHCKNAKPHFTKAANHYTDDLKKAFVAVDCTKNDQTCKQFDVKGFPTIIYLNFGKNQKTYKGGREFKHFVKYMKFDQNDPNAGGDDIREDWQEIPNQQHVQVLDENTFDNFINSKGKVLVMFYAPWCGHCQNMKPGYAQAATDVTRFLPGSYLAAIDATKSESMVSRFEIKGFPTLKYFENGAFKFDYQGGREKEDFLNFMKNPDEFAANKADL